VPAPGRPELDDPISATRAYEGDLIVPADKRIFLSHASADKRLADLLRDTLVLGGVAEGRIFYSSSRGTGIPSGEDVGAHLKRALRGAGLVIELLSETFLTRPRCLLELGGAWTLGIPTYPIVVPPLTREEAARQIGNVQMGVLSDDAGIEDIFSELHGRLAQDLGIQANLPAWNRAAAAFKQQLASRLTVAQSDAGTASLPVPPASKARPTGRRPWRLTQAGMTDPAEVLNGQADTKPAITDRWRLTNTTADAPGMGQLNHQSFDHRAYMRPADQIPPWVRIRAVVACDPLGETPGWQELRGRFSGLLAQEPIRGLIHQLTEIPDTAIWRQRGTHRRSWLQADLTVEDESVVPAASAILFLPEQQVQAGLQPGCAEFILHADFAPRTPVTVSGQLSSRRPPYWRKRFEDSLALPGELADWLKHQLGLETFGEPAAQSGIMLQAVQSITEMVDPSGIRTLSAPYTLNQFTGWAVADTQEKTRQELATQMMLDLSERVLYLDGSVEQMSGTG
jgi:hypothetical protein